jgi:tetratricopeptide (TPR) repeat protein
MRIFKFLLVDIKDKSSVIFLEILWNTSNSIFYRSAVSVADETVRLPMNIVEKLKALLKEAELYHSMGLLNESMGKYQKAVALIQGNQQLNSRPNLMTGVQKKIQALQTDMNKVEEATDSPEVSEKVQDLIKNLFAFTADKDADATALDGAIALAKFGQYERALAEFTELLKKESVRAVAAKNIFRCHTALSSIDAAVKQYEQWLASDIFAPGELNKLRVFLQGMLKKEGIEKTLPTSAPTDIAQPTIEMPESDLSEGLKIEGIEIEEEIEEDEIIDINSIAILLPDGSRKGKSVELDVSFQSGNVISLLIAHREKDLIDFFNTGNTINNIQFTSPIAIFDGSGIVLSKTKIESGPRRGDYSVDLKVISD